MNPGVLAHVEAGKTTLTERLLFEAGIIDPVRPEPDTALVRRLLQDQFPHWAHLPLRPASPQGWDNRTFRLGHDLAVRLPSAPGYDAQVEKEQRWLPVLTGQLPLPVP